MAHANKESDKYDAISELARRRGFFWPSYEIYGGGRGFLTYGHLGSRLKRRVEDEFREFFVNPLNILEMESSIITPGRVFEASGHVEAFREPMVDCLKCGKKFRADHLLQEQAKMSDTQTERLNLQEIAAEEKKHGLRCPECSGKLADPKYFMTMFKTTIGPYSDAVGYGRPEAAQGIFVEFKRLFENARERLPFGIAQIGHALRNEISPRQGPIRLREFTIADVEFFFDPEEPRCFVLEEAENEVLRLITAAQKRKNDKEPLQVTARDALQKGYIMTEWQAYFMVLAKRFLSKLGVPGEKQRFIEKLEWERAHYSAQGYDQEIYLERWGWTEVSGHNYRTDFDLRRHMEQSGVDMQVFKEYEKPKAVKKVAIEPVMAKIGPKFMENAGRVATLLSRASVEEVENSFKEKGYYEVSSFKIFPEHVTVTSREIEETGTRFIPHVVEPSFGIDRLVYIALECAYAKREDRTLMKMPREIAPVEVNVYPLVNKDGLPERAREIHQTLLKHGFLGEYDESGSIGRRYARADEVGTPLCITVDYQTLKDGTVTIRDRDSWKQVRAKEENLLRNLREYLCYERGFEALGKPVKVNDKFS